MSKQGLSRRRTDADAGGDGATSAATIASAGGGTLANFTLGPEAHGPQPKLHARTALSPPALPNPRPALSCLRRRRPPPAVRCSSCSPVPTPALLAKSSPSPPCAARPASRSSSSLRPPLLRCYPHGRWGSASPCLPPPLEVPSPCPNRFGATSSPPFELQLCPNVLFPARVAVAVVTGLKNRPKKPRSAMQGAESREENPQLLEHDDGLILFFFFFFFFLRWVLY